MFFFLFFAGSSVSTHTSRFPFLARVPGIWCFPLPAGLASGNITRPVIFAVFSQSVQCLLSSSCVKCRSMDITGREVERGGEAGRTLVLKTRLQLVGTRSRVSNAAPVAAAFSVFKVVSALPTAPPGTSLAARGRMIALPKHRID